jgi:hypothetical protein
MSTSFSTLSRTSLGPIETKNLENSLSKLNTPITGLDNSPQTSPVRINPSVGSIPPTLSGLQINNNIQPISVSPIKLSTPFPNPITTAPQVMSSPILASATTRTMSPVVSSSPTLSPRVSPIISSPVGTPRVSPIISSPITPRGSTPRGSPLIQVSQSPISTPRGSPLVQVSQSPISTPRVSPLVQVSPMVNQSPVATPLVQVSPIINTSGISPRLSPMMPTYSTPLISPRVSPLVQVSPLVAPTFEVPVVSTIKMPVDTSKINFQMPGLTDQTVETKMTASGFFPISRTLTKRSDGTVEARYIKSIDNMGNISYVKLNVDSNVSVQPSDLTTVEELRSSTVPYSLKTGLLSASNLDVSGLAFECADGICTISRDSKDMQPKESYLTYIEKPTKDLIVESENPMAYPIIKLSDILEKPTTTMLMVNKSTVDIRNKTLKLLESNLKGSNAEFEHLFGNAKITLRAMEIATTHIVTSLLKLENMRNAYNINPPVTPEEKERYRLLVFNIKKRQDMVRKMLEISDITQRYKQIAAELNASFTSVVSQLDTEFTGVLDTIYTS